MKRTSVHIKNYIVNKTANVIIRFEILLWLWVRKLFGTLEKQALETLGTQSDALGDRVDKVQSRMQENCGQQSYRQFIFVSVLISFTVEK